MYFYRYDFFCKKVILIYVCNKVGNRTKCFSSDAIEYYIQGVFYIDQSVNYNNFIDSPFGLNLVNTLVTTRRCL